MLQILYKYLILHSKAVIPGVGFFYIHRQPAYLDFDNNAFAAPAAKIAFTESAVETDKKFRFFLAKEKQIGELEAEESFSNFTKTIKDHLQANGKVELPNFGRLEKNKAEVLEFHPSKHLSNFYAHVPAERVVRKTATKEVVEEEKIEAGEAAANDAIVNTSYKKDYWWVFAIIFAAAAVGAIVYYYIQNGTLR